ncbi:iron complex transport system substrate-binding protein [Micromonospora phaseoli]|uniref:Iron complex transport system substrate-binding protein n=1 Tax=Micromonospora phaseoli TaxID=1144548 RepID=A0A1H6UZX0_9ACTN|nr:ABC transporter substrate-binding protein [Micromonospora phaseoli]PZV93776.1 iron complex transport system substrate-binding protein [Micromonospora phaseoli]GIJ79948.1 ABC transporter substrate-binding protein [Micromonospora phaseoli]SEI97801.1 iron complex transport system substrate-binding protein [Micromonospora phaseoli]
MKATRLAVTAAASTLTLLIAACGGTAERPTAAGPGYPVTVTNCGEDVTFDAAPERIVLLKSAAVPYLQALGVMDRVTARAGQYPKEYYDAETLAELDRIPLLTDRTDTSGHLQISKEVVISQEPDLVLGEVDNLSRDTLSAVDIPLLEEPAMCPDNTATPSFEDIYAQLETYGRVFGRQAEATSAVDALRTRMTKIQSEVGPSSGRTAAVLYPTIGGGTTYAYGTASMAHPQLEAAGFRNVFGDTPERVFEVTVEELLGRNPDVLILLYGDGDPTAVEQGLTGLPGAEKLNAVRSGNVMTQLFNFTEPPTALSIDGLERIVQRFRAAA